VVIHRKATGPSALGEQDLLFDVWIKGELERDGAREHLSGVGDKWC
jgi:hypothetical protein